MFEVRRPSLPLPLCFRDGSLQPSHCQSYKGGGGGWPCSMDVVLVAEGGVSLLFLTYCMLMTLIFFFFFL